MTRIRPFRGLRYDPARVDLSRVIAPPYDVVSPAERATLHDRDPHNAVHLDLTRDPAQEATTDYAYVADTIAAWRRERVLVRDPAPALYALRQRFTAPGGGERAREGFFALLGLEDFSSGVVRPHERTLSAPKRDRLRLLRATRANLSSLLVLYQDPDDKLFAPLRPALERGPNAVARDGEVEHELARVDDPAAIDAVRAALVDRPVVIADGHHRYETALLFRDECLAGGGAAGAEAPFEWVLACFANADAPGTLLLPIHRVILRGRTPSDADWRARLPGWTQRDVPIAAPAEIPELLERHLAPLSHRHAFAADDGSDRLRIFERPRRGDELTIRRIHAEVVAGVFGLDEDAVREGAVAYPKSAAGAAAEVRAAPGRVALYLNALTPDDVFRVTAAGDLLPQKSTFFLPKLPTGLVLRVLGEEA